MLRLMNTLIGNWLTLEICGLITKEIWRAYFHLPGPPATNVPGNDFPLLSSLAGLDCTQINFYSTTFSVEKDFWCVNRVS